MYTTRTNTQKSATFHALFDHQAGQCPVCTAHDLMAAVVGPRSPGKAIERALRLLDAILADRPEPTTAIA